MYQLRDNRGRAAPRLVMPAPEPVGCPWPTAWTPGCADDDGPWISRPSPLARIDRQGRSAGYGRFLRIIVRATTPAQLMRLWSLANVRRGEMDDGIRRVVDGALTDQAVRVAQAIGGRARIEGTVQALIGTLDLIDGDADLEVDEPDMENGDERDASLPDLSVIRRKSPALAEWRDAAIALADEDAEESEPDEDDSEDRCVADDDNPTKCGVTGAHYRDGGAGDADDAEEDDVAEDDDPAGGNILDQPEGGSWTEKLDQGCLSGRENEDDEECGRQRGHFRLPTYGIDQSRGPIAARAA